MRRTTCWRRRSRSAICGPLRRRRGSAGERRSFERPSVPRTARVKTTAVNSETSVPTPSVKAKPLTPAGREAEEDERGQQGDHVRVDDRRDPLAVAGGDRRQGRVAASDLLLYSLEDDDVGVRSDADRQDQAGHSRQRQRDRDQLHQREEEDGVDEQAERRNDAEEAVVDDQEEDDQDQADEAGLQALVERLLAERRRDRALADQR